MAYTQPSTLDELLRCCVVKVIVPGDWGTGFFIGEGAILTCEHVVRSLPEGSAVQFEWYGQTYEATVAKKIPPAQADVALLRFTPWRDDLPCVYLNQDAQSWQRATTYGFPTDFNKGGFPAITRLSGFGKDVDGSEVLGFSWTRVKPGRSGSPLLNKETGYVCGIIKFTQDPSGNFGGGAVPTAEILKALPEVANLQTAFHQRSSLWKNLLSEASADEDLQSRRKSSSQIVECLWSLDCDPQCQQFKDNTTRTRRAAAFVVQAKDKRIQHWLVKRLVNQIPNVANARVFPITVPAHPMWRNGNFGELWTDLARELQCPNEPAAVIKALVQVYRTKPIIMAMYGWSGVSRSQALQKQVLDELWQPLVEAIGALEEQPLRSRVILFLAEGREQADESSAADDPANPVVPIRLEPLTQISNDHLAEWFESDAVYPVLSQYIPEDRIGALINEQILEWGSDPHQAIEEICYTFGLKNGISDIEADWRLAG